MKKYIKIFFFLFLSFITIKICNAQNMGIGTATPDPSAKVDINSTTKGFLPPRLTFNQRNTISNPAKGLVIWCIDCNEMQVFNGNMWTNLSGASASVKSTPGVKICYGVWMYKNLDVRTYRNGDTIPLVTDPVAWANLSTGAMCWYNNDSVTFAAIYGRLYNWYAIHDARGLAPVGWRLSIGRHTVAACTAKLQPVRAGERHDQTETHDKDGPLRHILAEASHSTAPATG